VFPGPLGREALAHHQHFFHLARRQRGAPRRAPAGAGLHGEGVPRFAGAVAVERAGREVAEGLCGRHDNDAHVLGRIDAGGAQPLEQQQVMHGVPAHDAERELLLAAPAARLGAKTGRRAHPGVPEAARECERVAVEIEHKGGQHVGAEAVQAESHRPEHRGRHGRGVEFAADDLVPHGGPADLAGELDAQAASDKEPALARHEERRSVGQGQIAQAQRAGRSSQREEGVHACHA